MSPAKLGESTRCIRSIITWIFWNNRHSMVSSGREVYCILYAVIIQYACHRRQSSFDCISSGDSLELLRSLALHCAPRISTYDEMLSRKATLLIAAPPRRHLPPGATTLETQLGKSRGQPVASPDSIPTRFHSSPDFPFLSLYWRKLGRPSLSLPGIHHRSAEMNTSEAPSTGRTA